MEMVNKRETFRTVKNVFICKQWTSNPFGSFFSLVFMCKTGLLCSKPVASDP